VLERSSRSVSNVRSNVRSISNVVRKALDALDAVRAAAEPMSLHDLTPILGLPKSSLFRILHTLEVSGCVRRDANGRYHVPHALSGVSHASMRQTITCAALPHLRDLGRECGETASLAMRFAHHIEVIATIQSPKLVRMGGAVGRILPPHASALGKVILAFESDDARDHLLRSYGLPSFTPHTIVDRARLADELVAIRLRGYGADNEERVLEGCCFAAPVRERGGQVRAAVGVSMPRARMHDDRMRDLIVAAVRRAADATARDLRGIARVAPAARAAGLLRQGP
jgi:IclR family acetate operon transcriptional repressor